MRRFTKVSSFIRARHYYNAVFLLAVLPIIAFADTYSAKFVRLEAGAMVFQTNGTELTATVDAKSKFWRMRKLAQAQDFKSGEALSINLKTSEKGTALREAADSESARWLSFIRRGVMLGTITGGDKLGIFIQFADGTRYHYRTTEKAAILIGGQKATMAQLSAGMAVFIKGRMTSTLDTSIQTLSDSPLGIESPKSDEPGTMAGEVTEWDQEKHLLTFRAMEKLYRVQVDQSSRGDTARILPGSFIWAVTERTDSGLARAIEFHVIQPKKR